MNRRIIALAASLAAAGLAQPALAGQSSTHINKEVVSYSDLDLSTAKGQNELQRRIDDASKRVCLYDENGSIVSPSEERACRVSVRDATEVQLAKLEQEYTLGG